MNIQERLKNIKKEEEHLISFRILKVINIRFSQSQISIVSKPEGSSLRRQLFHGVRAVFSRPSSFLGGVLPFPTAKMQNSLGEQRRPD